jgi:hypothetical protein
VGAEFYSLTETEEGRSAMTFLCPQLVTFFRYGSFEHRDKLQQFFLFACARDPRFAHRLLWYLVAFCSYEEENESDRALMEAVVTNGGVSVGKLGLILRQATRRVAPSPLATPLGTPGRAPLGSASPGSASPDRPGALPSPRMSLSPVRQPSFDAAQDNYADDETSLPPPAPSSGDSARSPLHDAAAAAAAAAAARPPSPGPGRNHHSHFEELVAFAGALTGLSDELRLLPGPERRQALAEGLEALGDEYLPSNYLYDFSVPGSAPPC